MPGEVILIGVPLDLGAGRRGVDMGPSALRMTRLGERLFDLGYSVIDMGDVPVPLPETTELGQTTARYAEPIASVCEELCAAVAGALDAGQLPVVLGGDHSLAIGSVSGSSSHFRARDERIGLLWLDAHGDMNTPETTPSGNVHGMPVAHLLGGGLPSLTGVGGFSPKVAPENTVLMGIRDLDRRERDSVAESGITVFTMTDVDRLGVAAATEQAIACASKGTAGIHLSFDIDVMDPEIAPGVGTPKRGGLSYREANLIMEMLAESSRLRSIDLVETNPVLDDRNRTAEVGAELLLCALGKRIL